MSNRRSILAAGAAALIISSVSPLAAENLRMLTGWDASQAQNIHLAEKFAERVEAASNGEITVSIDGPEVVAPFEQVEPVQAGIFQLLFTHPAYHSGVTRAAFALDSSASGDPQLRRDIGLWGAIDEAYNALGLKLIAILGMGEETYQFVLRDALVEGDLPFKGMKIRGTQPYKPIIEEFGGVAVVLTGGEVYSAIDRGVVQGAAWPVVGTGTTRLAEVTNYYLRPGFGQGSYMMLMNLDAWNNQTQEAQKAIAEVALEMENESIEVFEKLMEEEVARMEADGLEKIMLSDDLVERMRSSYVKGFRALALETNEAAAKKIVGILEENNL